MRFLARSTISSINSPRPKQALGAGGGDSPGVLDAKYQNLDPITVGVADLSLDWATVSVDLVADVVRVSLTD